MTFSIFCVHENVAYLLLHLIYPAGLRAILLDINCELLMLLLFNVNHKQALLYIKYHKGKITFHTSIFQPAPPVAPPTE